VETEKGKVLSGEGEGQGGHDSVVAYQYECLSYVSNAVIWNSVLKLSEPHRWLLQHFQNA